MTAGKAVAPTPEEEASIRAAWADIGAWEERKEDPEGDGYECPLCDGDGVVDGFVRDATSTSAATIAGYGIGDGLRAAEVVAGSTGPLLALVDQLRAQVADLTGRLGYLAGSGVTERGAKQALDLRQWDWRETLVVPPTEPTGPSFFGSVDDEAYQCTSAEEYLDGIWSGGEPTPSGVVVAEYRPRVVSDAWRRGMAEWMTEALEEHFGEEFGGDDECWRRGGEEAVAAMLAEVVSVAVGLHLRVWQCEEVPGSRRSYAVRDGRWVSEEVPR